MSGIANYAVSSAVSSSVCSATGNTDSFAVIDAIDAYAWPWSPPRPPTAQPTAPQPSPQPSAPPEPSPRPTPAPSKHRVVVGWDDDYWTPRPEYDDAPDDDAFADAFLNATRALSEDPALVFYRNATTTLFLALLMAGGMLLRAHQRVDGGGSGGRKEALNLC